MARIFISYSRKNKEFCKLLADEIQKRDIDFWVDWEGIPPTVDWMKEIEKGIEDADTFLAIVSTDWIASKICQDELNIAVKNGKRLIPVVPHDIVWNDVPPTLAHLNFIFFTPNFNFDQQLNTLFTALDTDYDWLKTHRRLQVKALEWERANKENGFLLRGRDLEEAEQQISINANKDPHPTDIQREYVLKSRQGATKQRRITISILIGLIAGMLGVIALLVKPYVENAIAKTQARNLSVMTTIPAGSIDFYLANESQSIDISAFHIEVQPVTNRVYGLCVEVDKCTPPIGSAEFTDPEKQDEPVTWLTITQAAAYCEWVGRRLPSAPEWERAAGYIDETQDKIQFSKTDVWEWTSSYTLENSPNVNNKWNGNLTDMSPDWIFLQELEKYTATNNLEIYTNTSGTLGAKNDLSFRCAGT